MATLTIVPSGAVPPGANLMVYGNGFPSQNFVVLVWNNSKIYPKTRIDKNGNFSTSFIVPTVADGSYPIGARLEKSSQFLTSIDITVAKTMPAPATVPGAPVLSNTVGSQSVVLTWTAPSNGGSAITGYRIYRNNSLLTSVGSVLTYDDTAVSNGVQYTYQVSAFNVIGEGAKSNLITAVPDAGPGGFYTYTLFDDFTGTTLDATKWASNYKPSGLTQAQKDPALVLLPGDGYLHLRAEKRGDGLWYSASIDTKLTFKQKYGIFEARIKVPKGKGLWPAGPWGYDDATSQEIDGMEILANPQGTYDAYHEVQCLHCTVHWSGNAADQNGSGINMGIDLSSDFHVYAFEWRADKIVWMFDGRVVKTFTDAAHIPSVTLPVILDLGVSGWAGATDSTTPSPSEMLVDWVRVQA